MQDGNGEISLSEFEAGLREMGVFAEFGTAGTCMLNTHQLTTRDLPEVCLGVLAASCTPGSKSNASLVVGKKFHRTTYLSPEMRRSFVTSLVSLCCGMYVLAWHGVCTDIKAVLQGFDPASGGHTVSLPAFLHFLGKPYAADVGAKLRKILRKVSDSTVL